MDAAPPRLIVRRTLALIVDWIIASTLALVLALPLVRADTDRFRLSSGLIVYTSCQDVTQIPQSLADLVAPELPQAVVVCATRPYGIENGLTAKLVTEQDSDDSGAIRWHYERAVTVPIDNDGNPIAPMEVQSVLTLILMIGVGGWLLRRWGGRTPGKRLTGLRVEGSDSTRWWLGECLRLLPAVIVTGLSVIVAAVGTSALTSVLSVFGSPVGLLVTVIGSMGLVFWFYILPILRWRGQAWYDRMTGTFVVRG